jgi:predicted membrane-bound mannosyltransferase
MRKSEKIEYALLGLIVLFAAFLRIYGLGHPTLWVDESISAVASLNILEKGVPVLDSGLLYGRAYVFHYLQAFFLLFGQSDFLVRFISVIFGLLTVILGYFFRKRVF